MFLISYYLIKCIFQCLLDLCSEYMLLLHSTMIFFDKNIQQYDFFSHQSASQLSDAQQGRLSL